MRFAILVFISVSLNRACSTRMPTSPSMAASEAWKVSRSMLVAQWSSRTLKPFG